MLLKNKNAVIYGGGGSIGGAVARAFAREGAKVFVTGRNAASLDKVVDGIVSLGGDAVAATVNAMDQKEVKDHLDKVVREAGHVDISFNAIGIEDKQGIALVDMSLNDFIRPVNLAMQTQFITATAAARVMMKQRSGAILSLTATPGGLGYAMVGGFGPACAAMESFSKDLASEVGAHGIRVVNIRSAGSPDSRPFKEAMANDPERAGSFIKKMKEDTMLKELPMMDDIANVAIFLASDMAAKITGVTIDATVGTTTALNYKVTDIAFVQN
jgi:3-oxoacyl-[acyl-carrier protein] reductase